MRLFLIPILVLLLAGCVSEKTSGVTLDLIASDLTNPVFLSAPDDGTDRLFVVDQIGLIRVIVNRTLLDKPFLDLRDKLVILNPIYDERGLLGLAFHPGFKDNGKFYVYYSAPLRPQAMQGFDHTDRLSEFTLLPNNTLSPEKIILEVDAPYFNHDGGTIMFGPDGYLYLGIGDGGGANDEGFGHNLIGNGQNTSALLGKILRIDINGDPYSIPADNPFAQGGGRPEIYSYGFRNPYRFSFNSNELYVGDVGQNLWEEVDLVIKGGNYGWRIKEGKHCFNPPENCTSEGLIEPLFEYGHQGNGITGEAIIGGFIYKGTNLTEFKDYYIFGDYKTSLLTGSLFYAKSPDWIINRFNITLPGFLLGIGQDLNNELYILTANNGPFGSTGKVFKLVLI